MTVPDRLRRHLQVPCGRSIAGALTQLCGVVMRSTMHTWRCGGPIELFSDVGPAAVAVDRNCYREASTKFKLLTASTGIISIVSFGGLTQYCRSGPIAPPGATHVTPPKQLEFHQVILCPRHGALSPPLSTHFRASERRLLEAVSLSGLER